MLNYFIHSESPRPPRRATNARDAGCRLGGFGQPDNGESRDGDESPAGRCIEILIVEDSATQAAKLSFILQEYGYRTAVAASGQAALEMLARRRPTIVISDIVMPEMDGYQLCETIKRDPGLKDVPVVLLTALTDPMAVLKGLACGADNFITKPYDEKQLLSRVDYLLANQKLRAGGESDRGLEVEFGGKRFPITSERQQILDLLLSTYEAAVHQNAQLADTRDRLQALNATLEERVAARTAALAQADMSLRRVNRALRAISLCNQVMARAADEDELLTNTCKTMVETIACPLAWVGYPDPERPGSLNRVAWAGQGAGYFEALATASADWGPAAEPAARAAASGKTVIVADISREAPGIWRDQAIEHGYRAMIALPLCDANGVIGVLAIAAAEPDMFGEEECQLLDQLANDLAYGIGAQRDRAKSKRLQAELMSANQHLQAFTYAASHDLKSPLRGIQSFSTLLERDYRDRLEGDGILFLDLIRRNASRMTRLIDDLLVHAHIEQKSLHIEPVELRALIRAVLTEREEEIKQRGARIKIQLPDTTVQADPYGLTQVVRNLVENALKYSSEADPPVIEIGGELGKDSCRLWVRDNGIGFDMSYRDSIFEIFRRLHTYDEYPGSGVGLALVRKAMERIGGKVWAESAPAQGATFYLEMPI